MLALTHVPSERLEAGHRTHVARVALDPELAVRQHQGYCRMLRDFGVEVRTLDVNRDLPDSTFIEDVAIVLDEIAVLTSMGTEARRAELAGAERELIKYRVLHRIALPAIIEGGDVLRVGRTLYVGLSSRTSRDGVYALEAIVRPFGYRVMPVAVSGCLHLKTACTALPGGALLVYRPWLDVRPFGEREIIDVAADEPWAANTLTVGTTVCMAAEHERTADRLRRRGFRVRTTPMSEFAKAEGGVTCLSLLIDDSPDD